MLTSGEFQKNSPVFIIPAGIKKISFFGINVTQAFILHNTKNEIFVERVSPKKEILCYTNLNMVIPAGITKIRSGGRPRRSASRRLEDS